MALYFMYYNFGRVHQTLRVTPAMEAGVANHVWSIEEIVALPDRATLNAMNKLFNKCWAAAICVLGACIPANAECGSIPGSLPLHVRLSAFVFDGTVLRVDQVASDGTLTRVDDADLSTRTNPEGWQYRLVYVATMDVHRVWKGDLSPKFKVYFVWNWDGPHFKVGGRGIVFARAETEEIRESLGIDSRSPQREAWVFACSGARNDDEAVIKQLGPARKPSYP